MLNHMHMYMCNVVHVSLNLLLGQLSAMYTHSIPQALKQLIINTSECMYLLNSFSISQLRTVEPHGIISGYFVLNN